MTKTTITIILFLFMALNVNAQITINPGGSYAVSETVACEACPVPPACDSCCPACPPNPNPNIKIVDPLGGGDYLTVKDAVAASMPGWIILVKNGIYNRTINFSTSGTALLPITMKPYPGHAPVFDFTNSPDATPRLEIDAEYITIQGFEVTNGYDGIKIYKDHATIRNNHIHDNSKQGILVINASNTVIENNKIAENGVDPGECLRDGVSSPKHCHGIYFSNFNCAGANSKNTVRYNHVSGHGGAAVQFNGLDTVVCPDSFTGNDISYNQFIDNAVGMNLYYKFDGNDIKNNTFIVTQIPNTNENSPSFLAIWRSENNNIKSNVFYSNEAGFHALEVYDSISANNNVNGNLWMIERDWWKWDGSWRSDFNGSGGTGYQSKSGWDANGYVGIPVNGW
jgi:parallel beta-helix repeat protein